MNRAKHSRIRAMLALEDPDIHKERDHWLGGDRRLRIRCHVGVHKDGTDQEIWLTWKGEWRALQPSKNGWLLISTGVRC